MRPFVRFMSSTSASTTAIIPRLPRLPVPELRKTLDRYLRSIQPFLLEDEAHGGPLYEQSYALRVKWAHEFEKGVGVKAQEALKALDKSSPHNWLDDTLWIKSAYHEWRAPLPVNSNWWLAFINDPDVSREVQSVSLPSSTSSFASFLSDLDGNKDGSAGITPWQIRRAAWLVWRTLDFKERLDRQELHPETTRTGIWLRDSTARVFNTCRIPEKGCDSLVGPLTGASKHGRDDEGNVLVMVHDWCYTVQCYHPLPSTSISPQTAASSQVHPTRISPHELERRLRAIVQDAASRLRAGETAVPVGVLTADERDAWAQNYEYLRNLSSANVRTFETIHRSLFALSLDHYTYSLPHSSLPASSAFLSSASATATEPPDLTPHLHQIRSPPNAHNRWYDKPLTLIVESNARAGAMGEHSPCDALVPSILCEYAVVQGVEEEAFANLDSGQVSSSRGDVSEEGWERLDWVTDTRVEKACVSAEEVVTALIADSDDSGFWFNHYGTDWIKEVARLSPDAYIQMALQLAWYRTRGEFTATYETALTRMFARGRTETIRTFTVDSRAWVLSMIDRGASTTTRHALLRRAIQTHASLTREAATGRGIDRHLLGLRLMLKSGDDIPPFQLFIDELFERSQRWKLSTSGLSAGNQFRGTGFGAAYQDGYGINYLAGPDIIKFGIESKHSSPLTSTDGFKVAIFNALQEMKSICSADLESSSTVFSHL